MLELTAREIAIIVGGEVIGQDSLAINGVATLGKAEQNHLSFLSNDKYRSAVISSSARIVLVPLDFSEIPQDNRAWIKCSDSSASFSLITARFAPPPRIPPSGRHPSAVISETAKIHPTAHIGANATIEADVTIGENSIVEAGCFIGYETTAGAGCRFYPNVTIRERTRIGNNVIIHSGTVIGSDGFGYIPDPKGHRKIPQVGNVQIDDDVEIGANVTVDRARFDRTWIKNGVKIDNLVQVAHNVVIGENTFIVSQAGVSGSVEIGKGVILAGQVGISGHVTIGDGATIMGKAGVAKDVGPGETLMGIPAVARSQFWRQTAYIQKLPELAKKIKTLEKEIQALKDQLAGP